MTAIYKINRSLYNNAHTE